MAKTYPVIAFGQNAIDIKDDASFVGTYIQAFSNINDLEYNYHSVKKYATYEPNYWVLDGSYRFMPTPVYIGYISSVQSNSSSVLTTNPLIQTVFSEAHTSINGITLNFSNTGDWADEIMVWVYNASSVLTSNTTYYPTSEIFTIPAPAFPFIKIEIYLKSTNKPYRYARLQQIDFDTLNTFQNTEIKSANLIEQINPISTELPVNTLDFTIFTTDAGLSILDPTSAYAELAQRQKVDAYEVVNDELVYMGRFHVDESFAESDTELKVKCIDLIGILDTVEIESGFSSLLLLFQSGETETFGNLIAEILNNVGIEYEINVALTSLHVVGWLPLTNVREMLQQIAFAYGAYVTCARSKVIRFLPLESISDPTEFDYAITSASKGMQSPLSLTPLVTGVEITNHDFFDTTVVDTEIFSGTLPIGVHNLIFDAPHLYYSVSGGALTDYSANNVVVTVSTAGTVTVDATNLFVDRKSIVSNYTTGLPAATKKNVVKIKDATLVNAEVAADVTQRVYDYYQRRHLQKIKLYAHPVKAGDSLLIDTISNHQIYAIAEKITFDLSGGFTAQIEARGSVI